MILIFWHLGLLESKSWPPPSNNFLIYHITSAIIRFIETAVEWPFINSSQDSHMYFNKIQVWSTHYKRFDHVINFSISRTQYRQFLNKNFMFFLLTFIVKSNKLGIDSSI